MAMDKLTGKFLRNVIRDKLDPRLIGYVSQISMFQMFEPCWQRLNKYLPMIENAPRGDLMRVVDTVIPDSMANHRDSLILFWIANAHYKDWIEPFKMTFLRRADAYHAYDRLKEDENFTRIAITRAAQTVAFLDVCDDENMKRGQVYDLQNHHMTSQAIERAYVSFQIEAPQAVPYFVEMVQGTAMDVKPEDAPTYFDYVTKRAIA